MSNEIAWPLKPFYIQSRIYNANWALTADGNSTKLRPLGRSVAYLWTATPDMRGGATLTHVGSGKVLAARSRVLTLEPRNPADPAQLFRVEDLGGNSVAINTIVDWEQKINVYGSDVNGRIGTYGWDGGQDNEKWVLIEETGEVITESGFSDR